MKGKYPNGLRRIIDDRDLNRASLARALNTSQQNVDRWYHQERKLTTELAAQISAILNVTPTEIMFEQQSDVVSIPLVSKVSAGRLDEIVRDEWTEDTKYIHVSGLSSRGNWISLEVDGDSMDQISPPGSFICVDLNDQQLVPNGCYIIGDEFGGATYKRYRPNPDRFEPVSSNKDYETIYVQPHTVPPVIGRVKRSILDM